MIKVENLVKRYGTNFALNDVSFEIGEGEVVGLLGPNGAGKSTAMNILTGYLSTSAGKAYIGGIDILKDPMGAKAMIGFLPEQPPLYPEMTVLEYLNFVYELKGAKHKIEECDEPKTKEEHLNYVLGTVKLFDVKNRLIKNLSKGYKQRVGIAQALIGDPEIVIFDEPTVGLDPKQIIEVRNLIRNLGKKHTVILSTHILSEVQAVCERVIIINKGKIIADERTEDLTRTIEEGFRYEAKLCAPGKDAIPVISKIAGVKSVILTGERDSDAFCYVIESERGVDIRKALFALCAGKSWAILGLAPVGTDLESIFIRLVDKANGLPVKEQKRKKSR